jgi:hypothetical protein
MLIGLACALGLATGAAAEPPAPASAGPEVEAPKAPPAAAPEAASASGAPAAQGTEAPAVQQAAAPAREPAPAHGIALGPVVKDAAGREGRLHVVQRGDTLWEISDAYLGTPWVWPSLWRDNAELENPHRIFPGDKLFVNASEMRRLTDGEAERMLAGAGAPGDAPAALADGMELGSAAGPRSYRYTEIETAGFVNAEQLRGAATIVDSTVDRVWLGDHDDVIIGLGEGETEVGRHYQIFRTTNSVEDPETGLPVGHATLALGWLEVREVHPETSIARIRVSRGEIRRGDHLLPRERPSAEIAIGPRPDIEGRVVYTWANRLQMGGDDLVYLNRGADDGLQIGSPLEVFRPIGTGIDEAQQRERALPDHVVAKLLVIGTTPETATAVVTHAGEEINEGDWFRGSETIAR